MGSFSFTSSRLSCLSLDFPDLSDLPLDRSLDLPLDLSLRCLSCLCLSDLLECLLLSLPFLSLPFLSLPLLSLLSLLSFLSLLSLLWRLEGSLSRSRSRGSGLLLLCSLFIANSGSSDNSPRAAGRATPRYAMLSNLLVAACLTGALPFISCSTSSFFSRKSSSTSRNPASSTSSFGPSYIHPSLLSSNLCFVGSFVGSFPYWSLIISSFSLSNAISLLRCLMVWYSLSASCSRSQTFFWFFMRAGFHDFLRFRSPGMAM